MRNTQMMKVPEVCAELYRKENKKKTLKTCAGVHERGLMSFPWKASEIANWQREAFVKFVFSNTRECCPSLSQTNFLSLVLALHGTFRLNSSSSVARCFGWGDVAIRGNTVNFPSLSSVNVASPEVERASRPFEWRQKRQKPGAWIEKRASTWPEGGEAHHDARKWKLGIGVTNVPFLTQISSR